ncbi:50S ribosomal protein L11 methyltransferase [Feifania hominis]|uniref:Ribosomal protein L11 methyltransferase n=1 Tax=Feifania hominis TaxID=2763660 RepID=A0A926DCF7_9FIRM|nr:50S ribosomal protein L11 methyltransferase [Feifania hominis]MBC8536018.1 50S ribosomal protein L11 methyltransferase [Feifania hominis]
MDWLELNILTTHAAVDYVCARLIALGLTGFQIEDGADFEEFLEQNKQYWDYVDEELQNRQKNLCQVTFYVPNNAGGVETMFAVKHGLSDLRDSMPEIDFGSLELKTANINEEDWSNSWKQYFNPIPVGEKLLIRPEWEEIGDAGGRTVLVINPGMIFGTGSHHSTQLCMTALERHIRGGEHVLDLGCGSGILSIAALLLGAGQTRGIDIDENAVPVAYRNAQCNGIGEERCYFTSGNVTDLETLSKLSGGEKFDVIVANIVADVIIAAAPLALNFLKEGGVFITSGIIDERKDDVLDALGALGYCITETTEQGGWCEITATRPHTEP